MILYVEGRIAVVLSVISYYWFSFFRRITSPSNFFLYWISYFIKRYFCFLLVHLSNHCLKLKCTKNFKIL